MKPIPKLRDDLYLLRLEGTLYGALMARNLFKSNVTWSSYPFLPPTTASGFLAMLIEGERWIEGNGANPRILHHLLGWEDVWTLGAFPSSGQLSRKHFRAHLGDTFNYEAALWSAGQNQGKKLAVVEEFWTDAMAFLIISPDHAKLETLRGFVRGRIGPVAKKGCLSIAFDPGHQIASLKTKQAQGEEDVLGLIPIEEVGQMPLAAQLYRVPVSSRLEGRSMAWTTMNCLWATTREARFRDGVPILETGTWAISQRFMQSVCEALT